MWRSSEEWNKHATHVAFFLSPSLQPSTAVNLSLVSLFSSKMGINHAIDKWKWLAINIMDHTLPMAQGVLSRLNEAIDPSTIASLLNTTELTILKTNGAVDKWTDVADSVVNHTLPNVASTIATLELAIMVLVPFFIAFFGLFLAMVYKLCDGYLRRKSTATYLSSVYGNNVESIARSYAYLMVYHSGLVKMSGMAKTAKKTNVLLIGANESLEARLCCDCELPRPSLDELLFPTSFMFRSIKDAMAALDTYCTSNEKLPATLFVLLLISSQDPSMGLCQHEAFQVPACLNNHYYAIVGTGGNGAPAHKLSVDSKGPNGEPLISCLPLGQKDARVCF